jgi:hypothetical protein
MAFGLIWAAMLGAGLGLDRSLRDLRTGWGASAAWAGAGYCLAWTFGVLGLAENQWAWPLAAAACTVAVGRYLAITTAPAGCLRPDEPLAAAAASTALGVAFGFEGYLLVGALTFVAIFALAWGPLVETPPVAVPAPAAPAPVSGGGFRATGNVVEIGRRSEERRNDDEGGQKREEQREGEELAHAGCAGVAGQA